MRKRYYSRRRKANIRNIVLTVLALGALAALVFFGVRALQGRQGGDGTVQPTPTVAALATPTPAPTPPPAAVTPGLNENTAFTGERTIIRMEIDLDSENNTLSCIEEVTWRNDSEKALSEVVFRIFPNALKDDGDLPIGNSAKAFPQGANFEGVKFTRAMLGTEPLTYTMDGKYSTTLRAQMPESLEPGESATFLFAWKMDVPKGFFPLSYSATGSQNSWFYLQPAQYDGSKWLLTDIAKTGNPWFNESADYECVVRVDSKLGFASTGDVESTVDVGEMRVYTIRARSARNFAFATTSHSRMTTQQTESVTVTAYSAYNEKANLMAGRAVDILNYYTPILGDYPGNTLEIVQANLSEEAVVQDGLILLDGSVVQGKADVLEYQIALAIARQWLGCSVGAGFADEQALHIPMAQYLAAAYLQNKGSAYAQTAAEAEGAKRINSLRLSVGSSRFDPALAQYCRDHAGLRGGVEAFAACFEDGEVIKSALGR